MNRREALSRVALLLGGTVVGANLFLEGCKPADRKATAGSATDFSQDDVAFLDEVADTILPATGTPGAKAAHVGAFMTVMVKDCYDDNDQKTFRGGFDKINDASKKKFDKVFMEISSDQKHQLLTDIDKEQQDYTSKKKEGDSAHYFRLMKELTLLGYFTSEIGSTQALRYVESPGKYEGCIPYKKGDKAWAL
ncbi:MAG: gluconate 2-dehydrogenase subunit 3 family protein [Chitinophagaceae bacterium]|nr:gluconate 2-dehydrogenase subunit 3 family protein [Chitinophagaceae bacterium]